MIRSNIFTWLFVRKEQLPREVFLHACEWYIRVFYTCDLIEYFKGHFKVD